MFDIYSAIPAFFTGGGMSAIIGAIFITGKKQEANENFKKETINSIAELNKHVENTDNRHEMLETKLIKQELLLVKIEANGINHDKNDSIAFAKIDTVLEIIRKDMNDYLRNKN